MKSVFLAALLSLAARQDPADELRRQELVLRLEELAGAGRLEALAKAVLRELRGKRVDAASFDLCWKAAGVRRWDGKLEEFVAAWDKAAAIEAPAPGPALFRARLESLVKPKAYRERIEAAATRFPGEPALLWHLARARRDAGDLPGAATALETLGPLQGYPYDVDDFHRMLAQAYAEAGHRAAAVEHLRAIREDRSDAADLAALALQWNLPEEAVRGYRLAILEDPERGSLRPALLRSLQAAGEEAEAAAERRRLFLADGVIQAARVEDYFHALPPEGRIDEIVRTLRELLDAQERPLNPLKPFEVLAITVPADHRTAAAAAWEKSVREARHWMILAHLKRVWTGKPESMMDVLEKAQKRYPDDPGLLREKIEPLRRLKRFPELAAAYQRLVELDPDGTKAGPRPIAAVQEALAGLVEQKDVGAALRLGVLALSEPAADDATRTAVRVALKPACETAGGEFWTEVCKLKLPPAGAEVDASIRRHLPKLSDDEFAVRTDAARELQKLGLPAIPALLRHIDDDDAEVRSRTRDIIRSILSE